MVKTTLIQAKLEHFPKISTPTPTALPALPELPVQINALIPVVGAAVDHGQVTEMMKTGQGRRYDDALISLSYSECGPIQNHRQPAGISTASARYLMPTLAERKRPIFLK